MFDCLLGWRRASKCKRTVRQLQVRMRGLKNKRQAMIRQLKEDVAQLIKLGCHDIAFNRVEQLVKDEDMIKVFELLDNYCDVIIINLSYIRKRKDLPNDINEAVSSLVFASARCGDLPELLVIRELAEDRYGPRFERTALDLLPGNLVNHQVRKKLTVRSVSDDEKLRLVDEIARENRLLPEIVVLDYPPKLAQKQDKLPPPIEVLQVVEHGDDEQQQQPPPSSSSSSRGKINKPDHHQQDYCCDLSSSSSNCFSSILQPTTSGCSQNSFSTITTSFSSSAMTQSSQDELEYLMNRIGTNETLMPYMANETETYIPELPKQEIKSQKQRKAASSTESLPQFPEEEMLVYLDDVEEVQSSISGKEGSFQDQRVFKFRTHKVDEISDYREDDTDEYGSSGDGSRSSIRSRKMVKNTVRKRSRKRSVSKENPELVIEGDIMYYENPPWKRPPLIPPSPNQKQKYELHRNQEARKPCRDPSNVEESETEKEWRAFQEKFRRKSCELGGGGMKPPYSRAMSMPQERSSSKCQSENIDRTMSFPNQSPNHVHPKLPDYDDLAAKFRALKKEHRGHGRY
ncbi:unnamed protein product [Linum trigynum]|uniref:IST1-like protein n=1 Tax=Linum trigynum TaxID=586398 RepID=A0AAV2G8N5_9ROSI